MFLVDILIYILSIIFSFFAIILSTIMCVSIRERIRISRKRKRMEEKKWKQRLTF